MAHLHQNGGRFLSVLPRTRSEDAAFRATVRGGGSVWRQIHDKRDDEGDVVDRFSISEPAAQTAEGYRLIWYHSTRKAELDAASRLKRIERAVGAAGRTAAEARLAPDPVPRSGEGLRGGGGDPAGVRSRGLDHGRGEGDDHARSTARSGVAGRARRRGT